MMSTITPVPVRPRSTRASTSAIAAALVMIGVVVGAVVVFVLAALQISGS
jgi:hypothetical protein